MRSISTERIENTRRDILEAVTSRTLTHEQKVTALERLAESLVAVIELPEEYQYFKENGVICDLGESDAPPRPRYILPDYEKLMSKGCEFLELDPPRDLDEAFNVLSIFVRHVPSVTNFPVFIGRLDKLLEPFVIKESRDDAKKKLRLFMRYIDRTVTDSFCHADIGPEDSVTGRILLELEREAPSSVPNLTLLMDPMLTSDEFALFATETALTASKPNFANHRMFQSELGKDYAIASCYNGLLTRGGAYTLTRLRLGHLAALSDSLSDFWRLFRHAVKCMAEYMDARIDFIVNESGFFESNFLAREGFIERSRFTGMFGIVGLAECVNTLLAMHGKDGRYGHDESANLLGLEILNRLDSMVRSHNNIYCYDSKFLLHGQVGIDTDVGESPATRIPIGEELADISDQLTHCARFHGFFTAGTGDVFALEPTVRANPEFILDLVRGGFSKGVRFMSFYLADSDVVRVTGYLVKRSEMERLDKGETALRNTAALGLGSVKNARVLERKKW